MRQPGLRTRLTIWFAASVLLILAPFLAGILYLESRSMRGALDHHLREDLEVAAEMLVSRDGVVRWRTEEHEDPGYDAGPQRWVEVYNRQQRPLFLRGVPLRAEIRAALPAPAPGFRTIQTPAGAYVRLLTVEKSIGGREVTLRVARTEDEYRRDLLRLELVFLMGAPLAVLAAALTGYVVSGRMLAPLGRMADRARHISAEHLSERLPIESAHDELGQLAGVFNETFARLEESFDRLKQFTADASHELRTPLTAIRSVGEVGLREARDARGYQDVIGSMLEEVDRLSRVVETLLILSRWDSGTVRPDVRPADLREIAAQVVAQLSILAEDRGVILRLQPGGPVPVTVDPIRMRQAIGNVLDNAIKFTPAGKRVTVITERHADDARIVVDDEGPGIPVEERRKVLDRFYRVKSTGPGAWTGAGLGLAIVHRVITSHGGQVVIEASASGGTRVILMLPA